MDAGWWYAVALAVVLALGAAALGMAQQRYKDHPRTPHLLGIGMAVCIFAAVAIIGMVVLGALGMGVVRSITIPAGAAILAFGLFWPQIERYAGYRPHEAPTLVPTASSTASSAPVSVPEQGALSVTSAMGREKRPDRAYFATHLETGKMLLHDATNPEPFGGPPSHTLADQAYGTWTVYNDAARPAINVHLSFAYQWQRMGHTEALSVDRTVGITIPRIDGKSRSVIRIVNFTSEHVLHISPAANCAFEAPGDTSQRPCILQGANPARRENILTLFPAAHKDQHAREPSGIIESGPAPSDTATATFRNVRTGETHSVSALSIANDQEQTEYLLNLIDLYAQSRNTERGWLSTLLDPATRIGAPFPPRDKQYDYPRAINLLGERGLVRILDSRKREYVDMIGLSIHEDFEFERLNRLAKNATTPPTPAPRAASPEMLRETALTLATEVLAFLAERWRSHPYYGRTGDELGAVSRGDIDYLLTSTMIKGTEHANAQTHDVGTFALYREKYHDRVEAVISMLLSEYGDDGNSSLGRLLKETPRTPKGIRAKVERLRALAGGEGTDNA